MSYVVVDLNMFRSRELPATLKAPLFKSKVAVEGHLHISRETAGIPCMQVFSANQSTLNSYVRPGIGVLCSMPTTPEEELKLASFIAEYARTQSVDREHLLNDWSIKVLDIQKWAV